VCRLRVIEWFALAQIAGLALKDAPCTNDLHLWQCNIAIAVPSTRDLQEPQTVISRNRRPYQLTRRMRQETLD
jgi:hypothetical protein